MCQEARHENTYCIKCERLFDFNPCSFAGKGIPPEGAEYTTYERKNMSCRQGKHGEFSIGYHITYCPEFEPEKKRTAQEMDTQGCINLFRALTDHALRDYAKQLRAKINAEHQMFLWTTRRDLAGRYLKEIEDFTSNVEYQKRLRLIRDSELSYRKGENIFIYQHKAQRVKDKDYEESTLEHLNNENEWLNKVNTLLVEEREELLARVEELEKALKVVKEVNEI